MKKIKKSVLAVFTAATLAATLASCGAKDFTFEFVAGDDVEFENIVIKEGTEQDFSVLIPKRDGYAFEGWYTNEDCTGDAVVKITASENLTFYAKWAKLYTVTIDGNGGTVSKSSLSLKENADVKAELDKLTVSKSGLTFAGWYKDDKAINSLSMPKQDITVVAKYKQNYTVEYYLQDIDTDSYVKTDGTGGQALVGSSYTDVGTVEGYTEFNHANSVGTITIDADANNNVIKRYFNKNVYSITYNVAYPDTEDVDVYTEAIRHGEKVDFAIDVAQTGYILMGWATEEDGEVVYNACSMDFVFNDDNYEPAIDEVTITSDLDLYAVWNKGYTNMFSGEDHVYLLDENDDKIYLERNGVFFVGDYNNENKKFTFYNLDDDIILEGKLNADGTFAYSNDVRVDAVYTLYADRKVNENVNLYFDQFNGCTYAVKDEEGKITASNGEYKLNSDNSFTATFTTGEMAGKTITFITGTVQNGKYKAFQIRNDEEYALKDITVFYVNESIVDVNPNVTITLNGYGVTYIGGTGYYYTYDKENGLIELQASGGQYAGSLKLIEYNGETGIAFYNKDLEGTYVEAEEDGSLVLDGVFGATYTHGDTTITGVYRKTSLQLGDTIIEVTDDNGELYRFMLMEGTQPAFRKLDEKYNEYLYVNSDGGYYAPLFVTEDNVNAKLYAFVSKGVFALMSSGTYTVDENGQIKYTVTNDYDPSEQVVVTPIDIAKVKSFVAYKTTISNLDALVWSEYTTTEDTNVSLVKTYQYDLNNEENQIAIELCGNIAFVVVNGAKAKCDIKPADGVYTLTLANGNELTIAFDEETMTFTDAVTPLTVNEYVGGQVTKQYSMKRDIKGNWTYTEIEMIDGEQVTTTYAFELKGTGDSTVAGFSIYLLEGKEVDGEKTISFEYILFGSTTTYFARYNKDYDMDLMDEDGMSLTLDGFGFVAVIAYEDFSERGTYEVDAENQIIKFTTVDNEVFQFKYNLEDNSFVEIMDEVGSYLVLSNQNFEYYASLDGMGTATFYIIEKNEEGENERKTVATYEYYVLEEDDEKIIMFFDEEGNYLLGNFQIMNDGQYAYKTIALSFNEEDYDYIGVIDKDFSVVLLSTFNTAIIYGPEGSKETGTYTWITDSLFYYVNDDQTFACVYNYDDETSLITFSDYSQKGYFTEDFEALLFTQYGYVVYNGKDRAFYEEDAYGDVIIYRKSDSENANEYGYEAVEFGEFMERVEFEEKTYYKNSGFAIEFKRAEENVGKYNFYETVEENGEEKQIEHTFDSLYFTPSGLTFEVNGVLIMDQDTSKGINVVVVREQNEDGTYSMYFIYKNNYRIDIKANYKGIDEKAESLSTYEISNMSFTITFKSFTFAYLCYYYYSMTHQNMSNQPDNYGGISVYQTYDETGKPNSFYVKTNFTDKTGFTDSNGNVLSSDHANVVYFSGSSIYATVEGSDGYNYILYMTYGVVPTLNIPYVMVQMITRVYETTVNGYNVTYEQLVSYQEQNDATAIPVLGKVMSIYLSTGEGEEKVSIPVQTTIMDKEPGISYAVSRTIVDDKITAVKYYKFTYTLETREDTLAPLVTDVKVEEVSAKALYTVDGESFVEIIADGTLQYLSYEGTVVQYSSVDYDEATKTYTVSAKEGEVEVIYTVVVGEENVTITKTEVSVPGESEEEITEE